MNPFLRELPPGVKLLFFFISIFIGIMVGGALAFAVATGIFGIAPDKIALVLQSPSLADAEVVKWVNIANQIGTFLLPVLIFTSVFGSEDFGGLRLKKVSWMVLVVPLWIAMSGGIVDLTAVVNNWLIPEGSRLEQIFKPLEDQATALTKLILSDTTARGLFTTALTIAIIPSITEELLFRGVLQPLLMRVTGSPHQAVWITAMIFSFIHFQFYGFIPRMILGAMLGYAVYWSGSLWTSIIAHFINNALAIVLFHLNGQNLTAPEGSFQDSLMAYALSALVFAGLGYYLWRNREKQMEFY